MTGMAKKDCLFCKFVAGELPCHKVWEDDKHLAFLTIFPNTPGVTVVITKKHYPSYAFALEDDVYRELTAAAKKVGKLLDSKLPDVGRTALVLEGMAIDHMHVKLYPLHGTKEMKPTMESGKTVYFENYPGYITTLEGPREDDKKLAQLAEKLRG
jgi:diadenosine tetraphosphate (Ap4A) HIT family hydrolase